MSVAKDPKTGKWYSKFRYTDWTGKRVQKKKTGFITKREAQEWEREFLTKAAASCDMSFASLVELYMADCKTRLRATTWENKQHLITKKLLPYFGSTPINQITPLMIRNWQNTLMELRQPMVNRTQKHTSKLSTTRLLLFLTMPSNTTASQAARRRLLAAWENQKRIQCCSGPRTSSKLSFRP